MEGKLELFTFAEDIDSVVKDLVENWNMVHLKDFRPQEGGSGNKSVCGIRWRRESEDARASSYIRES